MVKFLLELTGTSDCSDITAEVWLDQRHIVSYTCSTKSTTQIFFLDDAPANHQLQIRMQGKLPSHSVVASDGSMLADASILVSRIEFEDIDMMPIFCQGHCCYFHNHNDPNRAIELDEFYGYIGCNGTVSIDFATPIYLWFNKHF